MLKPVGRGRLQRVTRSWNNRKQITRTCVTVLHNRIGLLDVYTHVSDHTKQAGSLYVLTSNSSNDVD